MRNFFEQDLKVKDSTFSLAVANSYHAINNFHAHPEMELIYISSGEGIFSIGNLSKRIHGGMMLLVGCNVPHMFKFETNRYYDYAMKHAKTPVPLQLLTLHFDPKKLGKDFLSLPENFMINNLLEAAKKGLMIGPEAKNCTLEFLQQIEKGANYEHLPLLLQLLNNIGEKEGIKDFADTGSKFNFKDIDETRLTKVYLYTMDNFYKEIKLNDIAVLVHMVPNAFCHYFKQRTGRTYFDFLISVRIEHACKLLKEKYQNINSISIDSGFSNISNFNRYFKLHTGKSPVEYRRSFRD